MYLKQNQRKQKKRFSKDKNKKLNKIFLNRNSKVDTQIQELLFFFNTTQEHMKSKEKKHLKVKRKILINMKILF